MNPSQDNYLHIQYSQAIPTPTTSGQRNGIFPFAAPQSILIRLTGTIHKPPQTDRFSQLQSRGNNPRYLHTPLPLDATSQSDRDHENGYRKSSDVDYNPPLELPELCESLQLNVFP